VDAIADALIAWFDTNARDLPWRRADTGWLARWPTPAALAADPPAEAIRAWGRLGYPRRALRLHGCATAIVARHDGEVPGELDDLLALPGIGGYTARAVAAFAFGQRQPVVDTNVRRVVARAVSGRADAGPTTTAADLTAVLALLPDPPARAARAGAAFMELGALLCTARAPRCPQCPLSVSCVWRLAGRPALDGPSRRPQRYAGTDRYVRGLLLAVLRDAPGPVPATRLDLVWPDAVQRSRALSSLVADGLVSALDRHRYALPGGQMGGQVDRRPAG
jgi:A/G-specific adenine glycosylase